MGANTIASRPVLAFFLLAFAISWGGILLVCLPHGFPGSGELLAQLQGPVFLFMLAGPFFSALILTYRLGGARALVDLFRGFTKWRAGALHYIAAICLIPASALAVLLPLSLVSPAFAPGFLSEGGGLSLVSFGLVGGLAVAFVEETGWTGFATPRLLRTRGVIVAAIGLGIIHGLWHLLTGFWFEGARFGLVFVPYFLTAWILALVVMRVLAVRLVARTGNTLMGVLVHASHTGGLLAIWPLATTPLQDLAWTAGFAAVGGLAVMLAIRRDWI